MKTLSQEEVKKFNDIVSTLERNEKGEVLTKLKSTMGDARDEYIRSVINSHK